LFLARFTLDAHLTKLAEALSTVEQPNPALRPNPATSPR